MVTITLNEKQERRADILSRLIGKQITKLEAASLLRVSTRQIERMVREYRDEGFASVIHGNAGRSPSNKTPPELIARILALVREGCKYHDFNTCHLHEILAVDEGIRIGRSTLDALLKKHELRAPRPGKPVTKRRRRERCSMEGMMLQIDGSPHDWLEGRGAKMTLLGAVDDATGKIIHALFRPTEDQAGYLMLFRHIAVHYGLPESFYHDRHTMLRSPKKATIDDELAGRKPQSQLQWVMEELGVASIAAHSPQAKGRIERLWETLQGRLPKEMRLAGVQDIQQANAFLSSYLPRFNALFQRAPAEDGSAWVSTAPDMDLAYHFSTREARQVRNDHTIACMGKTLLILRARGEHSLAGKPVAVHEVPEGDVYLYDGKTRLRYQEVTERPSAPPCHPEAPPAPRDDRADTRVRARQMAYLHTPF